VQETEIADLAQILELGAVMEVQAVEQRVVVVAQAGLRDQTCPLFDDQQMLVLIGDAEGDGLV
jgi:hypothetical protein